MFGNRMYKRVTDQLSEVKISVERILRLPPSFTKSSSFDLLTQPLFDLSEDLDLSPQSVPFSPLAPSSCPDKKLEEFFTAQEYFLEARDLFLAQKEVAAQRILTTGLQHCPTNLLLLDTLSKYAFFSKSYDISSHAAQRALEVRRIKAFRGGDAEQLDLSLGYNNLAVISLAFEKKEEAKKFFHEALTIRADISQRQVLVFSEVATTFVGLGSFYQAMGNVRKAEELFGKALKLRKELTTFSDELPTKPFSPFEKVAMVLEKLASVYAVQKQKKKCIAALEEVVTLRRAAAQGGEVGKSSLLGLALVRLGECYIGARNPRAALLTYQEAQKVYASISKWRPDSFSSIQEFISRRLTFLQ